MFHPFHPVMWYRSGGLQSTHRQSDHGVRDMYSTHPVSSKTLFLEVNEETLCCGSWQSHQTSKVFLFRVNMALMDEAKRCSFSRFAEIVTPGPCYSPIMELHRRWITLRTRKPILPSCAVTHVLLAGGLYAGSFGPQVEFSFAQCFGHSGKLRANFL